MPRVSSEKLYSTFIKGLVTEASPLTYPENASLGEDNFVLERNGSRSRRLGVDYEFGYSLKSTGLAEDQIRGGKQSFHKWESPSGDTTVSIGVIRIYNKLWFIDLLTPSPSANFLNSGNPVTITGLSNSDIETTVINNNLIVVSADLSNPVLLKYNKSTGAITQSTITLLCRDIWGVYDGLAVDNRPTSLSDTHKYNLRNQGWSTKITSTCGTDAIDCTRTNIGAYPSNADIWTLGKVGNSASPDFEEYDPATMVKNSIDNAQAARGSYIINAFARGASRSSLSGISSIPTDIELGTITTVAAYSSRVFYSGVASNVSGGDDNSPNFSGYIFFSQTVTSNDQIYKCYQEADPTSPNISDIIDTDGGTVQIPEITRIIKLVSTQSSLLVFAENGVWEIYGDTGGFKATSFQIAKVSAVGIANPKAVVEAYGAVFYFSKAGIYVVSMDPSSGRYKAESISLTSIQSLYNSWSDVTKNNAKGFFDEKENRIRWLFNDSATYDSITYVNKYNKELILDLTLQAFYLHSISSLTINSPYVADYIDIPGYAVSEIAEDVYVGTDLVQVSTDTVQINTNIVSARGSQFSFLTLIGTSFTISKYTSRTFRDWYTADNTGADYLSYLVTGYELFGDVMRKKQVTYAMFYFEKTEDGFEEVGGAYIPTNPSGCFVQVQWDWTNSAEGNKWGTPFQAYRLPRYYVPSGITDTFDSGEKVIVTKNKVRGTGRALSFKIYSESGKDCHLYGWALTMSGNGSV